MNALERDIKESFGDEVAVTHRVNRVGERLAKTEQLRGESWVNGQRRAGERAGTQRRHVEALTSVEQSVDVAQQGPPMGT